MISENQPTVPEKRRADRDDPAVVRAVTQLNASNSWKKPAGASSVAKGDA